MRRSFQTLREQYHVQPAVVACSSDQDIRSTRHVEGKQPTPNPRSFLFRSKLAAREDPILLPNMPYADDGVRLVEWRQACCLSGVWNAATFFPALTLERGQTALFAYAPLGCCRVDVRQAQAFVPTTTWFSSALTPNASWTLLVQNGCSSAGQLGKRPPQQCLSFTARGVYSTCSTQPP